jgi:hypothetical protein
LGLIIVEQQGDSQPIEPAPVRSVVVEDHADKPIKLAPVRSIVVEHQGDSQQTELAPVR